MWKHPVRCVTAELRATLPFLQTFLGFRISLFSYYHSPFIVFPNMGDLCVLVGGGWSSSKLLHETLIE